MAKSTVKKKRFTRVTAKAQWVAAVNLFIKGGAKNGRAAMLKAGLPESTAEKQSHRLKKHPIYIEWIKANVKKNIVTKEALNEKLLRWASSNVVDYFNFGDFAVTKGENTEYRFISVKDLTGLPREITDCIAEIQETSNGIRIKLVDKLAAVSKLAEINGLIAPRQMEVGGRDGKPIEMKFIFGDANLKPYVPDTKNRIAKYN